MLEIFEIIEIIAMAPLALIGLVGFILIGLAVFTLVVLVVGISTDLVKKLLGRPTVDEEWQAIHVDSNMNHGQGPFKEDK